MCFIKTRLQYTSIKVYIVIIDAMPQSNKPMKNLANMHVCACQSMSFYIYNKGTCPLRDYNRSSNELLSKANLPSLDIRRARTMAIETLKTE